MKKLSANEVDRLVTAARSVAETLDEIDQLRTETEREFERLLSELAEPQEEVRSILEDAANAAEEYYDERSEKWQEGEIGDAYAEWKARLRELADAAADSIDPPEIAEVERPDWVNDVAEGAPDFAEFEAPE